MRAAALSSSSTRRSSSAACARRATALPTPSPSRLRPRRAALRVSALASSNSAGSGSDPLAALAYARAFAAVLARRAGELVAAAADEAGRVAAELPQQLESFQVRLCAGASLISRALHGPPCPFLPACSCERT